MKDITHHSTWLLLSSAKPLSMWITHNQSINIYTSRSSHRNGLTPTWRRRPLFFGHPNDGAFQYVCVGRCVCVWCGCVLSVCVCILCAVCFEFQLMVLRCKQYYLVVSVQLARFGCSPNEWLLSEWFEVTLLREFVCCCCCVVYTQVRSNIVNRTTCNDGPV